MLLSLPYFNNTDEIVDHLYQIDKYDYILRHVLLDQADHVAIKEINNLRDYEEVQLNKVIQKVCSDIMEMLLGYSKAKK
jgi:hypothetical protein